MRTRTNQAGFSVVELVIVLAVVAVLGFIGYNVHNRQTNTAATTPATSQSASGVADAPAVNSTSDLDKEQAVLDQTDTSSSADSAQLDSQLQAF